MRDGKEAKVGRDSNKDLHAVNNRGNFTECDHMFRQGGGSRSTGA
jgi:hypothetical protein